MMINFEPVVGDSFGINGQELTREKLYRNPGQNEKPSVVDHEMEVFFFGGFVPPDQRFPGFDRPCSRSPAQACDRLLTDKGHILEMVPDNLTITQVMILLNQAVIEWFKGGVSDQLKSDRFKIRGLAF